MDDKSQRGEPDRTRINLQEEYEVRYWADKFGVSKDTLVRAVETVGSSPVSVEVFLKKKEVTFGD